MTIQQKQFEDSELIRREAPSNIVQSIGKNRSSFSSRLFPEKLAIPPYKNLLVRPRLDRLLYKSTGNFGATLLLGRAGTGKTALAASFARRYKRVAWYSIDSLETDWRQFIKYFSASFKEPLVIDETEEDLARTGIVPSSLISHHIESYIARLSVIDTGEPRLLVLDNAHNVFDAEWFSDFFGSLIYSLLPNMHLVMVGRSYPPIPLWRMRSKQRLGVIDEEILAFNLDETIDLFKDVGLSEDRALEAHLSSYGRISRIKEILRKSVIETHVSE